VSGETKAVTRRPDRTPLSQRDPVQLAQHFVSSGFFKDANDLSKAVVKMVAGEELGLGPMASMQGIHIIEGKPSLSANLLGVQVKRSGAYNFRPKRVSAEGAEIAFFENGEEIGISAFTLEQAKRAGLVRKGSGWEKYPEAMLFARALSQGVRWYCPDVTAGSPAYTPEELGAEVDEQGEPIPVESTVEVHEPQTEAPTLDPARVVSLVEGIDIVKPQLTEMGINWWDGLNMVLGSLGIDAFDFAMSKEESFHLSRLTVEQADKLDAELQRMADEVSEEVDGEVVEEERTPDGVAADAMAQAFAEGGGEDAGA